MSTSQSANRSIAVFIDFENLALGFRDRTGRFEIKLVLKRLLEKGKIVAKKAYCDWSRFNTYTASLHESAIELVEIPKRGQTGKNSADIRLCVDAMDLAYSKLHIDTFVIVSGDSDFSPLVSKLKELGKHVIGIGMNASTSALLRDNCDEFIYYEDLVPVADASPTMQVAGNVSDVRRNAFNLLFEALTALRRDDKEFLGAAMVKNTICRMHPGFNESQFGYRSFSGLLQDAAKEGLLELTLHQKAGTWVVAKFGDEMKAGVSGGHEPSAVPSVVPAALGPQAISQTQPHASNRHHGRRGQYRGRPGVQRHAVESAPTQEAPIEPAKPEPVIAAVKPAEHVESREHIVESTDEGASMSKPKPRRPASKRVSTTTKTRKKST